MEKLNITNRPSPNHTKGRSGHIPDIIVCHITEGNFPGAISWVTNKESGVSYHYMVSKSGDITQCVDIQNTAWANGTDNAGAGSGRDNRHSRLDAVRSRKVNANLYTISIGFEGKLSETGGALTAMQTVAAASLIANINCEMYRIWGKTIPLNHDHIVGHRCITPKHKPNCPGAAFPFDEVIKVAQEVQPAYMAFDEAIAVIKGTQGDQPSPWAADAWQWAKQQGITDGTRPEANVTRQEVVAMLHRYHLVNFKETVGMLQQYHLLFCNPKESDKQP